MSDLAQNTQRIFISHSSKDNEFGVQLAQDLREVLHNDEAVWYDAAGGLHGGDSWWSKIIAELSSREVFIVILSHDAMSSQWVNSEVDLAWRQKLSPKKKHIIPILYKPCDIRLDLDTLQVISFLAPKSYETAFDELLTALGLPKRVTTTKPDDLGILLLQQIEQAFADRNWHSVIRKTDYIIRNIPTALSATVYQFKGRALFELGDKQQAQKLFDTALALASDNQHYLTILSDYTFILASLERWEDVLRYATEALYLAPGDPAWLAGQQQAKKKIQECTPPHQEPIQQVKPQPTAPKSTDGLNDLFKSLFSGTPREKQKGADIHYPLTITFEEAIFGCQKEIELLRWENCSICQASGAEPGTETPRCPDCYGTGEIHRVQQQSIFGQFVNVTKCERCDGEGRVIKTPCSQCHGMRRIRNNSSVTVNIPAGVDDGINVRLTGEGEAGIAGGTAGNLYVVLSVKPHPFFKREGNIIIYNLSISKNIATFGGKVEVPTIDNKPTLLKIPPDTQNGQIFRLKGKGVPVVHSSARGDYHVTVNITSENQ